MATSDQAPNPQPIIPIVPANHVATENLLGYSSVILPRRDEIFQILSAEWISRENFPEAVPDTRFNYELFSYVDTTIRNLKTFKIETGSITKMSTGSSVTQQIITPPEE